MKKIQHNEPEVQQKPAGLLPEAAIGAVLGHRNWSQCSDFEEAIKVWGENVAELEKALRANGHGDELDRAVAALDAENAEYEAKNDL